ncbi:hypothetical protein GGX14DRAFT_568203 [Mycena pura]|uniref:Uncharacterized protein n=1 Tax=Mycena pura TaxID=153505 RepID=A0AAD6V5Y5_9AGAR|nr:hypothetical protein GGX14DRAFT_572033 [Mycena pura]KAJ7206657.1 hypothetical protein GGX14DRAFT_568203 [Mycena pura]
MARLKHSPRLSNAAEIKSQRVFPHPALALHVARHSPAHYSWWRCRTCRSWRLWPSPCSAACPHNSQRCTRRYECTCAESALELIKPGLEIAAKYYHKFSQTDAYLMAMFINPSVRLQWIQKHWSASEVRDAKEKIIARLSRYSAETDTTDEFRPPGHAWPYSLTSCTRGRRHAKGSTLA